MGINYRTKITCVCLLVSLCSIQVSKGQFLRFKKKAAVDTTTTASKYAKLIQDAVVDSGVINVLKSEKDYYFEINKELFDRDFLIVNKLSQVPFELNDAGVNKGMNFENLLIQFSYNKDLNKVFVLNYKPLVEVPSSDMIARSVNNNYRKSILESFDVEAVSDDSTKYVIKVNKVYDGSEKSFNNVFGMTGLGSSANSDRSYISSIKSFDDNITAKSVQTTKIPGAESEAALTVEVTSNLVLLSKEPMNGRFLDARVGYFSTPRWYFNDMQQGLEKRELVTRWRLEPKDKAAYFRGELVEPVKPILFYVDPATPKQWREYIIRGVEEWNEAFEQAGFKNAVVCKEVTDEKDFDLDDTRYSVITYVASDKANAMGPSVVDPRSGEILEADIIWWHNVITAVKSWMRVQTGIIDPASRDNEFEVKHMGEAIRFICSHEVGHTFGLRHNMGASSFSPVDSLRSPSYTNEHATASSIMDYARFNYVAQPEDQVTCISPQIGDYDKFAIEWAYRYYGDLTPWEDQKKGDALITEAYKNPLCVYLPQQDMRSGIDPRAQSEDLGDNSVKASLFGIENLKRIMPQIVDWTTKEGDSYEEAGKLLNAIIGQWHMYAYHVLTNVGGVYVNNAIKGDGQQAYEFVPEKRQREAVDYLLKQVFASPAWLFKSDLYNYVYPIKIAPDGLNEYSALSSVQNTQSYVYWDLLTNERMARMLAAESQLGSKAYTVSEMLLQLHRGIFKHTIQGRTLSVSERASQKSYVDALIIAADRSAASKSKKSLIEEQAEATMPHGLCCSHCNDLQQLISTRKFGGPTRMSDAISLKRGELLRIEQLLKKQRHSGDWATKSHYEDLLLRIDQCLR
nr:DUF5117 domain-containing protein [Marinilabiliaceae bacterium JC017]